MRFLLLLSFTLLFACADRTTAMPEDVVQVRVDYFDVQEQVPEPMDILFVIDSSPAMAVHEQRLADNFPRFIDAFTARASDDLHLGVITGDLGGSGCGAGDGGVMRHDGLVGSPFIINWRHLDGSTSTNYPGALRDAFTQIATVGHDGCADQRPLDAIRVALEHPRNFGFRRPDARLFVVLIAGSDDRSQTTTDEAATHLRSLVTDQGIVVVSGIFDEALPKLDAFLASFPNRSTTTSILGTDLSDAMVLLSAFHDGWWGDPCIEGQLVDVDPERAGEQYDCSISDVIRDNKGNPTFESVLTECAPGSPVRPCWRFERDRQNCPLEGNLRPRIDRHDWAERGTHVVGYCVTE